MQNENAKRDDNDVPSLLGTSNVTQDTTVTIYANPITHALVVTRV